MFRDGLKFQNDFILLGIPTYCPGGEGGMASNHNTLPRLELGHHRGLIQAPRLQPPDLTGSRLVVFASRWHVVFGLQQFQLVWSVALHINISYFQINLTSIFNRIEHLAYCVTYFLPVYTYSIVYTDMLVRVVSVVRTSQSCVPLNIKKQNLTIWNYSIDNTTRVICTENRHLQKPAISRVSGEKSRGVLGSWWWSACSGTWRKLACHGYLTAGSRVLGNWWM